MSDKLFCCFSPDSCGLSTGLWYLIRMTSRALTGVLLLGLVGGLCGPLTANESAPIQFQESYTGPHPAEFAELLGQVKSLVPAALAYISAQWNLPNQLHYPLIVIITDHPPNMPAGASAAYVRSVFVDGTLRQTLIVDLQNYVTNRGENLDNLLYHEMAHVVLQDAVTGPAAAGIPQWFNEGLAQSVTSEGHDRTAEDFKRYGHSDARAILCDLNGGVDTFYHGEYNFGCYTQFYLAVERLLALGGKETVANVIAGLHNGMPLPGLTGAVAGLSWPAFQQDVQQYTQDVFAGNKPIP